jgi:hypothetical protein
MLVWCAFMPRPNEKGDHMTDGYWREGETAVLRYRRLGPVSYALPARVVHDGPDHTALYLRPGTAIKKRVRPDGSAIARATSFTERHALPHLVGDGIWGARHALILVRPGDAHDIRLFWEETDWSFAGWYVNLQRPIVRTGIGFDTADHILDLRVSPDLSWEWKDETELAEAVAIDRFTAGEAAAIRAEGERVIAAIERRAWPFNAPYPAWRPPADWTIPTLPENWAD